MQVLNVRIDNVNLAKTLEKISGFLVDGRQHYVVTVNPEFIVLAQKDAAFREILNRADLSVVDGVGIVLAARMMGEKLKRVAGVDMVESLKFKVKSQSEKFKFFLLGGTGGSVEKIARDWPAVVGFSEDLESAIERINQCQPNILLVALGPLKQEKWIAVNLTKMPSVKVAIGVGGAFKFLSGQVRRAPQRLRAIGLEWVWRTIAEPSRIIKVWRSVVVFGWLLLKNKLFRSDLNS